MTRVVLAVIVIALARGDARGQSTTNQPPQAAIAGSVVDALTGQPLSGAQVLVRALGGGRSGEPSSTRTNSDGQFAVEHLSPGRYLVSATHDGYVNQQGFGARRRMAMITGTERIDGFVVRLTPSASISGRILDNMGKPLPNASVRAMRRSNASWARGLSNITSVQTNAAGEYRVTDLPRGDYFLRASYLHPPKLKAESDQAYVPFYYPGVGDFSHAVALNMREGEELSGIDIRIAPVHTVRVRGRVVNVLTSLPAKDIQVKLTGDDGEQTLSPTSPTTGPTGAFEFLGVPPGSYLLVAGQPPATPQGKTLRGRTTVEVGDRDVEDVEAAVGPGLDISGRVHVDGSASVDLSRLEVSLSPQDSFGFGFEPDPLSATVKADGTFLLSEVPEGNYTVNVFPVPSGYYAKTTPPNLLETGITVGRGTSVTLDFTLSPGLAQVEGTVMEGNETRGGVSVVLVPEGSRRAYPRFFRQAVTDQSGRFALRAVPPGDYKLFAAEDISVGYFMDSDPSSSSENQGKEVHLEEGAHAEVQLEEMASD